MKELGVVTWNLGPSKVGDYLALEGTRRSKGAQGRPCSQPRAAGDHSPPSGRENRSFLPAKITADTNIGGAVNAEWVGYSRQAVLADTQAGSGL